MLIVIGPRGTLPPSVRKTVKEVALPPSVCSVRSFGRTFGIHPVVLVVLVGTILGTTTRGRKVDFITTLYSHTLSRTSSVNVAFV